MVEVTGNILVVDDEQQIRLTIFEALNSDGYNVSVAENGQMALDMLHKNPVDLIVSDVKMPGLDGIELLKKVKVSHPGVPVVILTGFASVDSAVEAMKVGAFDYILKPCPTEVIVETVGRALALVESSKSINGSTYAQTIQAVTSSRKSSMPQKAIIGKDPGWLKMVERAKTVASSKATVLILGESGTGKEVVAQYVHNESDRKNGPFVALNCAALPDTLMESELFGHEKGAFTGAIATKKGKFEMADKGTLLLDEIGEVPLHLQAKLLRVLQEEEVDRLGGRSPVKFDVHVIATTNVNLEEAVNKGEFRQDLFYRLNVIPLRLPALRERPQDILILAEHFIEKFAQFYKKDVKKLSKKSAQRLLEYSWPGNVREMENMIERALLLSSGDMLEPWDIWDEEEQTEMAVRHIGGSGADSSPETNATDEKLMGAGFAFDDQQEMIPLRRMERQMIIQALQKTDNNRTHAAKMLGISVRTLRNKLSEYRNQGFLE